MRELSALEIMLVAGGSGNSDIVVTGPGGETPPGYPNFPDPGPSDGGGGGGGTGDPGAASDADSIDTTVLVSTALTQEQAAAVEHFKAAIARDSAAIRALFDGQKVTLADGDHVTVAELKDILNRVDVEIVDNNYHFSNGSGRGEADWNNNNPVIRTTIDNLVRYEQSGSGGLDYLFLHELSHFTAEQRADLIVVTADGHYTEAERHSHEQDANDIVRAIEIAGNLPELPNAGDGYNPDVAMFNSAPHDGDVLDGYIPTIRGVIDPNSGVTVARGVDLGHLGYAQVNAAFQQFWAQWPVNNAYPGFEQSRRESLASLAALQPYMGLTGQAAADALNGNPLHVSALQALILNTIVPFGR